MTEARDDQQPWPAAQSHQERRQHWPGWSDRGQAALPRNASGRLVRPQSEPDRPERQQDRQDQPPVDLPEPGMPEPGTPAPGMPAPRAPARGMPVRGLPGNGQAEPPVPHSLAQHWPERDRRHDGAEPLTAGAAAPEQTWPGAGGTDWPGAGAIL